MNKTWIGCAKENFQKGRPATLRPEAIVVHCLNGSLDSARVRFMDPKSSTSAHYAVSERGDVHQYVDEADTAFHAGVVVNGTWELLKTGVNPNFYTIGIEHEGDSSEAATDEQYDASAALIAEVACRWNISLDAAHVVMHSEIRASRSCPGNRLDRGDLVLRAQANAAAGHASPITGAPGELQILLKANVRESVPFTSARIVQVLPAGAKVKVSGYTKQGQRIQGNSVWYQTEDANFIWAGTTGIPQPENVAETRPVPPANRSPIVGPSLCKCGVSAIDALLRGSDVTAVAQGDSDRAATGVIQDLLTGHGYHRLPSLLVSTYGVFSEQTRGAVSNFQAGCGITPSGEVDGQTMQKLVTTPAVDPRATQAYVTMVLGIPFGPMQKILSLVAQMEGLGRFTALNRNTDRAGLSFGLIQWAQRPGRLFEILIAFSRAQRDQFVKIFGDGSTRLADALLDYVHRPSGGVDSSTGSTRDPAFDLIMEPWIGRFAQAALLPVFQRVQVQLSVSAFQSSYEKFRTFAAITSERAVACMIDIANQVGDAGLERLYRTAYRSGMDEHALLVAIADASIARTEDRFRVGVRARRNILLQTALLSDDAVDFSKGAERNRNLRSP